MRAFLFVFVVICGVLPGCASTGSAGTTDRHIHDVILEREHAWVDAMRAHDTNALESILAAEFRLTFSDIAGFPEGRPPATSRDYWLGTLSGMSFGPVTIHDAKITRSGERFAVAHMTMTLEDWYIGDRRLGSTYELVDVWVLRDGRWQAKSRASHSISDEEEPDRN